MSEMKVVLFKNKKIQMDATGLVCLNDIHKSAGFTKNQTPSDWIALPNVQKQVSELIKRNTGKSGVWTKEQIKSVYYTKKGNAGGTWAIENLALAYAAYLSPTLAVEIRDVFLRFKKADATLADEVLERASPEENEWAATRALGRVKRNEFTKALQDHEVKTFGFANCTDAVYKELFDGTTKKLKLERNLDKKANLRNNMTTDELVAVMFAETLSKQRIQEEGPIGNSACISATRRSSAFVRQAIEADRNDRQPKLM